ncbi:MAG: hypothetical protein QM532_03130 [Cyanobium sp. MAG06]|nr:hypothetical protein [Cyanobium sp. MAG06]
MTSKTTDVVKKGEEVLYFKKIIVESGKGEGKIFDLLIPMTLEYLKATENTNNRLLLTGGYSITKIDRIFKTASGQVLIYTEECIYEALK